MTISTKLGGVVVPLVTPVTIDGQLDFAALERLIEFQITGGVEGLLLLGTTGEGPCVPRSLRLPFIERAVAIARKRLQIYANVTEQSFPDTIAVAREFSDVGIDAIVALPPLYFPPRPTELAAWFRELLDAAPRPVLIYNIPATAHVSIPLDVIAELVGHPSLAGLKDSENDPKRHAELLRRFGGRDDFSIFVGVGALMAEGLKSGADGIVPSVGNMIPGECQQQVEAARRQDWGAVDSSAASQAAVAALYQKGRTLAQSLVALKALLHLRGLCSPAVFPPLLPLSPAELEALRGEAAKLQLA
jgi:dihydrodipicolinate synthase/N-acetylneuraminate lyase